MREVLKKQSLTYLLFFLLIMVAYWQIAFLQNSVQYDLIDVVLPWRYFVTECFMNGEWPLWNPYQQCGYPIYADPQYPIFTPEVLLLAPTIGYSNITLHYLLLFYIAIAGVGIFKLSYFLFQDKFSSVFAGVVYCLSGFFVGHASSLTLIIAGAWLPFAIYYFLKLRSFLLWKNWVKFTFFGLLMVSSGYQPISFILLYLLLVFVFYYFAQDYKNKNLTHFKKWLGLMILSTIIILLCMLPILVGIIDSYPYVTRMGEISPENLIKGSFTLKSFLSFFLPFGTVANDFDLGTDISMANIYTGIFPLFLFTYSFFTKRTPELKIIAFFAISCFLISLGNDLPLRLWISKLPLMGTFRFPAIFRLFSIFGIALLSAHVLKGFSFKSFKYRLEIVILLTVLFGYFLVFGILYSQADFLYWAESFHLADFKQSVLNSSLNQRILLQLALQIILYAAFLIIQIFCKLKNTVFVFALVLADLLVAVQLCIWGTGINAGKPLEIYTHLDKKLKGFPPPVYKPLINTSDVSAAFFPLWHNTNIFEKRISCDCMTSFIFKEHEHLFNDYKRLSDSLLQNSWFYLSDHILPISTLSKDSIYNTNTVFIEDSIFKNNLNLKVLESDQVEMNFFSPNRWVFSTVSKNNILLNILQSHYIGWKCYVNKKPEKTIKSNLLFTSVFLKSGFNQVEFRFENKTLKYSAYIGLIFFVLLSYFTIASFFDK